MHKLGGASECACARLAPLLLVAPGESLFRCDGNVLRRVIGSTRRCGGAPCLLAATLVKLCNCAELEKQLVSPERHCSERQRRACQSCQVSFHFNCVRLVGGSTRFGNGAEFSRSTGKRTERDTHTHTFRRSQRG